MRALEIVPFTSDHTEAAGSLLASRHQRDRAVLPDLPVRFEEAEAARGAIQNFLARPWASGFAALREGRLVGYMVGEMNFDEVWGRSGWVRPHGFAVAPDEDPEALRDLYAALGDSWLRYGCLNHFVVAPTADPVTLQKFYSLSFGIEQIHALMDLRTADFPKTELPLGLEIRLMESGDRATLEDLSEVIWRHQVLAPVWGIHLPEIQAQRRTEYGNLVDDEEAVLYLAFVDGQTAGMQGFWPAEPSDTDLITPEKCVELAVGGTVHGMRRQGVGTHLAQHGLREARDAGAEYCLTDWRSTNLLSSRFWPKIGFRPVAYRLSRRVDPRITWAGDR